MPCQPPDLKSLTSRTSVVGDLATMCHSENKHKQFGVMDLVDDSVITRSYSPLSSATDEPSRRRRTGCIRQELDHRLKPAPSWGVELAQLARR